MKNKKIISNIATYFHCLQMIINKAQLKENYDIVIIGAGIAGLALSQL